MSNQELSTEQLIKEAARSIFQEKGFAATKTRDIAEAAGINLALLNYYFRSKKKLFDIIMMETMQSFFAGIIKVLNDETTSLDEKIEMFVAYYIDLLSTNPNIPTFILNTVREHPEEFISQMGILEHIKASSFVQQFQQGIMKGEIPMINPIHLMINILSLVVFPFIAKPMISTVSGMEHQDYLDVLQERKRLIPLWVKAMLTVV